MRLFPSGLDRALSDHEYSKRRCKASEARYNHTAAVVQAELLLSRAYAQSGTDEPWIIYEAEYKPQDEPVAVQYFETIQECLTKRKAVTERYRLDDRITVENIEIAPATAIVEGIAVHAPQTPMERLVEEMRDFLPQMVYLQNDRR